MKANKNQHKPFDISRHFVYSSNLCNFVTNTIYPKKLNETPPLYFHYN